MSKQIIEENLLYGEVRSRINENTDELYGGAGSKTPGKLMAILGTSLMQHNTFAASNKMSKWSRGWVNWAEFYSMGRFSTVCWHDPAVYDNYLPGDVPGTSRYFFGLNFGVSGNKSHQIEDRVMDVITTMRSDIVFVDMGPNDMSTPETQEEIQAYVENVCDILLANGKKVILSTIPTRGTVGANSWEAGSNERKKANWSNSRRRRYCEGKRGMYLYDVNRVLADTSTAASEPFAGYSDDNAHSTPRGAEPQGYEFASFIENFLPKPQPRVFSQDDVYDAVINTGGNILSNPFCLGTSGTFGTNVTGTVCTGMRVEGSGITTNNATAVASKETRPDNRGDWQVITVTPNTTQTLFLFRTPSSDISHPFNPGDWVQASFEMESNDFNGFGGITLYVRDQGSGGLINYGLEPHSNGLYPFAARARKGIVTTHPFQIVSGSTTIRYRAEILVNSTTSGASGTGVVKIGALELRRVDDPRIILDYTPPV